MLQKHVTRVVSAAALCALTFLTAFAGAQPQNVSNKDLYSFLAKSSNSGILRGSDVKKYPKLEAILGVHSNDSAIAPQELQQRFDKYVSSLALLFAGIDSNKDGKISVLEIAQRTPKLLVYFPYIDLNRDGVLTFDELLSTRIVFNLSIVGAPKSLQREDSGFGSERTPSQRNATGDDSLMSSDSNISSYDAFVVSESAKLDAFFARNARKDDPAPVPYDTVVITGSNYQSTSGFYPTYGMWVNRQDSILVDGLAMSMPTNKELCNAAMVGLAALGCAAISVACTGVTAVTFGGFAIPCAVAIPVVCVSSAAISQLNVDGYCNSL